MKHTAITYLLTPSLNDNTPPVLILTFDRPSAILFVALDPCTFPGQERIWPKRRKSQFVSAWHQGCCSE